MKTSLPRTTLFSLIASVALLSQPEASGCTNLPSITCLPSMVLLTCSNAAVGNFSVVASNHTGNLVCSPPSGSVFPLGVTWVTCTATNVCGDLATCEFAVTVKQPSSRWDCLQVGIGIPFETIGGADIAFSAQSASPDTTTPTMSVIPAPGSSASGLRLVPGPARTIRFTTVLDFTAPVGAGFDLFLPPDPLHPNDPPLVSIRNKGPKGYCVKQNKRFADEPGSTMRSYAVNTNGDLLDPITFTPAEVDAIGVCDIGFQPGVSNCHVTVEVNLVDGSSSVEFDGPVVPVTPTLLRHKGWDGCIYGPDRPRPKPPKTARVIMVPPALPPGPPITEAFLYVSGWPQMLIEEPSVSTQSTSKPRRRWSDGHVTLMKAYDDDSMEFAVTSTGGGVQVDLGSADSFDLRLTKFETNALPGEELLTRTLGPISGLTNPPPPFLDAMQFNATPDGVACSADFSHLESPTVRVQVWLGGALVTQRTGVPAQLGQTLFTLSGWPERIGKLGGTTPCRTIKRPASAIILPDDGSGQPPEVVIGDECRVLAETPPGTPHPDYYSGFEFIASEDADWGVSELQVTSICVPVPLDLDRSSDGVVATWAGDTFRLQGAVDATGPWFDLGAASPAVLPVSHPARFFRLVCD
jgi:hypothetical protein